MSSEFAAAGAERHTATVERLIAEMRRRIAEPAPLAELAEAAGLSRFHLERVFMRVTGVTPGAYAAALRIERAKLLLLQTTASVTEICFDLGYESLGSFTTRFGQLVGISPTAFRLFAARFASSDPAAALADAFAAFAQSSGVNGTIGGSPGANSFVWIGVFPKGMPTDRPATGSLRRGDGDFSLAAPLPDRFVVLAAALPPSPHWIDYFVFDRHVRVAAGAGSHLGAPLQLQMRPLRPTDPPLLAPLPLLALGAPQFARSPSAASALS